MEISKEIGKANTITSDHSILIGDGLVTNKSYHLLVNRSGIKIDKIMTKEEYQLIHDIITAVSL